MKNRLLSIIAVLLFLNLVLMASKPGTASPAAFELVAPVVTGACCVDTTCYTVDQAECEGPLGGVYMGDGTTCDDNNTNGIADLCETPSCPGDVDGNGVVNVVDLLALLGAWGACP